MEFLVILSSEISSFLVQPNSARIVASAAYAFREVPTFVIFDLRKVLRNATFT